MMAASSKPDIARVWRDADAKVYGRAHKAKTSRAPRCPTRFAPRAIALGYSAGSGLITNSGYPPTPISGRSRPASSTSLLTRSGVILSLILNQTYAITKPNTATTTASMHCMASCEASPYKMPRTPSEPYCLTISSRTTPFQPAPYSPVAKMPTEITPHRPFAPWTATAPTQSSTPLFSMKRAAITTSTPEMAPMITAPNGLTNAHGAVIATRPASMPLTSMPGSGFSPRAIRYSMHEKAAATLASMVLTTTNEMRKSVPERVEPGLNPNQPKARMKQPTMAMGKSGAGMGTGLPLTYLPMRAPTTMPPASSMAPPMARTTPEPAKSTAP